MATLTLSNSFGDDWPPDALAGGTNISRSDKAMTYTSDSGYTVTLLGTGFTYDDDGIGMPSGGTIGSMIIRKGGKLYAKYTDISADLARSGMLLLGYDDNGNDRDPDTFNFLQNILRGDDLMTGSAKNHVFFGSKGNDTINAGAGSDLVGGEQGDDVMDGGDGWDTLYYDQANYSWESYRGVDLDAVTGLATDCWGDIDSFSNFENFKDSLYSDTLNGSDIDEEFSITRGNDSVDGRGGVDLVDYSDAGQWGAHLGINPLQWGALRGIYVNLGTGVAIDSWKGTDTLTNIEGVYGTSFKDTIIGSGADETFLGGDGVDAINMGRGHDKLGFWNVGDDNDGGHGIIFDFSAANNVVNDGYGNTENALGVEMVVGSRFNDSLTGNDVRNWLFGGDGNDTITGGSGEDDLAGEWGNDLIFGGRGYDQINGGYGDDTLTGDAGGDQFNFNWDLVDSGFDTIVDFQQGLDNIWIANHWGGGFDNNVLVANQFWSGPGVITAVLATERLIYDTDTGELYFDADGLGGVAAVRFATLSNLAALTFDDFNVFL